MQNFRTLGLLTSSVVLFSAVNVSSDGELQNAIISANLGGDNTINFVNNITLTSPGIGAPNLRPINANYDFTPGNYPITINGNNFTLNGANAFRGFFVRGGTVSINNLNFGNTLSEGGQGGDTGGGGGSGIGGSVIVGTGTNVTLVNPTFVNSKAQGGHGGAPGTANVTPPLAGGGGGMAGSGGFGGGFSGGGGGGLDYTGGNSTSSNNSGSGAGGAGVGFNGGDASGTDTPGNGGNNYAGAGGGAGGSTFLANGSPGSNGGGGGGGHDTLGVTPGNGGAGGAGGIGGGGGGGGAVLPTTSVGGAGGDFGGGGGGGFQGSVGGAGGIFGGGGCGGNTDPESFPQFNGGQGGNGGFGGGGGGGGGAFVTVLGLTPGAGGTGGFAGGNGDSGSLVVGSFGPNGAGGGGAGFGGALFLQNGGNLTIQGAPSFSGNSSAGGLSGGGNATSGSGLGQDIFMMSSSLLTFNITNTVTLANPIQSDQGAGGGSTTTGGLTKSGTGTLDFATFNLANTYTGTTTINDGILKIASDSNLGVAANPVVMNTGIGVSPTLEFAGNVISARSITLTGLQAATLQADASTNSIFSGIISGTGSLTKTGTGVVTFSGVSPNTYTGTTTVNDGILILNKAPNNFAIAGNAVINGGSLVYASTNQMPSTSTVTINGGAFDLTGNPVTLGTLIYNGGTLTQSGALLTLCNPRHALTMRDTVITGDILLKRTGKVTFDATNNGTAVIAGNVDLNGHNIEFDIADGTAPFDMVISGVISNGGLKKKGPGTLYLTGENTYSHGAKILKGTLVGNTNSLQPNIVDKATLVFYQDFDGTYQGKIRGPGELIKNGLGTVTLIGKNTYNGGTVINEGALKGNTKSLQRNILDNATIIFEQTSQGNFHGIVSGTGALIKTGEGTLVFTKKQQYTGQTFIEQGKLRANGGGKIAGDIVDNSVLIFQQNNNASYSGNISGSGKVIKTGEGTLALKGTNNYTGGTRIKQGALKGNTQSITGNIVDDATLIFDQKVNAKFGGNIKGTGELIKTGNATLTLTGDNTYTGGTIVKQGKLKGNIPDMGDNIVNEGVVVHEGNGHFNGTMKGKGEVHVTGRLGGSGTTTSLTVKRGGRIAPGNSIGTLKVSHDYTQEKRSTYELEVGKKSDLIQVSGKSHLKGGTVDVDIIESDFAINKPYVILKAKKGLKGTFDKARLDHPYLTPVLSYDDHHTYMTLKSDFGKFAKNSNEAQVAEQLDGHPSSHFDFSHSLNKLSGEQYTNLIYIAQQSDQRFIQRIYYPLARRIGSECQPMEGNKTKIWTDGQWGRSHQHNDDHAKGYKSNDWNFTLGIHQEIGTQGTIGIAGAYEQNHVDFKAGGVGHCHTILGALYGAYNPDPIYIISNLVAGYSHDKVKRPTHSKRIAGYPKINHVTFYTEIGGNIFTGCGSLQPFAGLEVQHYHRSSFEEHGRHALKVKDRNVNPLNSRLGLHLATLAWCEFTFGADVAWLHRFYFHKDKIRAKFRKFGHEFNVEGVDEHHDAFQGSLNFTAALPKNVDLFAEASGQVWSHFYSYTFTGGLSFSW